MNYHLYEADALQLTTCKYNGNNALVTSDKKLAKTSKEMGIRTILIPNDEVELKALIQQ